MRLKKSRRAEFFDEDEELARPKPSRAPRSLKPFRILDLPSEIRERIYHFALFTPSRKSALKKNGTIGASAKKHKAFSPTAQRINLFLTCRRIHDEASYYFFSTQVFRIFPVQDFAHMPTVRQLPRRHRGSVTTIELILGSSWTAPPKSWTVNQGLGLHDMVLTRTLKVWIECDPSQPIFEGFRVSKDFYTNFAGKLFREILERLPNLAQVEFDAYPSVHKNGGLMTRLLEETQYFGKKVLWGPDRGWVDDEDDFDPPEEEPVEAVVDSLQTSHPTMDILSDTLQLLSLEREAVAA
ncbi:hypothetical protein POX_b02646 [Penicillium oxalicum]|uniref:F-box domain-containing protein n=1 Tax=Penicillium oxalicum (strain 114-2 / CGMCC 5302) TaxID=933388 RepID=S7ZJA2_PENO1|nr:hypothetical protein POX_b02646 [Penicillium oxalicum]EPS30344.1 hypothetical protein PDE_05295 [Penicillium oxalicum 114-2]KAI2792607.1 hypothetical protein POX_b02646 [Penicillium oxalicum]